MVGRFVHHHHAIQFGRPGSVIGTEYLDFKRVVWYLGIEYGLCIKCAVIVANPGVITADNKVARTHILAEIGVQNRLAGTSIQHVKTIAGDHCAVFGKIKFDHGADRVIAHVGRNIPGFQLPE